MIRWSSTGKLQADLRSLSCQAQPPVLPIDSQQLQIQVKPSLNTIDLPQRLRDKTEKLPAGCQTERGGSQLSSSARSARVSSHHGHHQSSRQSSSVNDNCFPFHIPYILIGVQQVPVPTCAEAFPRLGSPTQLMAWPSCLHPFPFRCK